MGGANGPGEGGDPRATKTNGLEPCHSYFSHRTSGHKHFSNVGFSRLFYTGVPNLIPSQARRPRHWCTRYNYGRTGYRQFGSGTTSGAVGPARGGEGARNHRAAVHRTAAAARWPGDPVTPRRGKISTAKGRGGRRTGRGGHAAGRSATTTLVEAQEGDGKERGAGSAARRGQRRARGPEARRRGEAGRTATTTS